MPAQASIGAIFTTTMKVFMRSLLGEELRYLKQMG
jgi:hypothetical protein